MASWVEVDDRTLEDLVDRPSGRSAGLHVSEIYGDIVAKIEGYNTAPDPGFLAVGLAFEEVLGRALGELYGLQRPGEFVDKATGIIHSPDGVGGRDFEGVDEIKVTWKKAPPDRPEGSLDDPKFLKYHLQGKAYARVLGVNRVRYRVLFVRGDWWGMNRPQFRTWIYTYSDREIEETWRMLVQHARDKGWL